MFIEVLHLCPLRKSQVLQDTSQELSHVFALNFTGVLPPDNTVLIINENNELEILPVTVLRAEPKNIYISNGVKTGARVITTALDAPIPGTRLRTGNPGKDAASVITDGSEP